MDFTYSPRPPPPRKSGLKLVCNVIIANGNLKSVDSQDDAQKPQRNCSFMNSASAPVSNHYGRERATKYLHIYVEYRAVSGVFRTIDPPPPLSLASVSSPRTKGGVVQTRRAVRGWGGSIFRKTPDIGLASYNIIPLRKELSSPDPSGT
jgi:hypothetical protein